MINYKNYKKKINWNKLLSFLQPVSVLVKLSKIIQFSFRIHIKMLRSYIPIIILISLMYSDPQVQAQYGSTTFLKQYFSASVVEDSHLSVVGRNNKF